MPAKRITDAFVRNVNPPKKDDKPNQVSYIDTMERGLALELVVSYGGTRTFRVITYCNGKAHSHKLGNYPHLKLKEARAKAREYWQDPLKVNAQSEVGSFKDVSEKWIKRHVEANKLRSQPEIERQLARYVYPRWKGRKFLEIRRREVNELLDHIADNHGRSQADAVLATVRSIMTWHQSRDEDYTSPIVRGMRRNRPRSRDRILDDDEIRSVWTATNDMGSFGTLVKLALLTAQRREKIANMKWDDFKGGVWTIHTENREKGTAGVLELPKLALDILEAQPRIAGNPHIFAGTPRGRRRKTVDKPLLPPSFNSWSQRKEELDAKLPTMKPWVIHDLRRTARSLMSRAHVRPDIAERVLGHAIPGIEGVYDRYRFEPEKADALSRLANLITQIVEHRSPASNVVSMALQKTA